MKVSEIYTKSKAWMFEKLSSTIYNDYIIEITNKVLAETYDENNMCRMFYGKKPFMDGMAAHQVKTLNDEIDYEDEYVLDVIPKGIDANFLMDDDMSKKSVYDTEYANARVMHQKIVGNDRIKEIMEMEVIEDAD